MLREPHDNSDTPLVFSKEETPLPGKEILPADINGLWTILIIERLKGF